MNWEAIGATAELVAAITVIGTLIYLSQQIRQGTHESRLSAIHDISKSYTEWMQSIAESQELSNIFDGGMINFDALEHEQRIRFIFILGSGIRILDDAYSQHTSGRMDEKDWSMYDRVLDFIAGTSGIATYMKRRGHLHSPDFFQFVEKKIKNSEKTETSLYL